MGFAVTGVGATSLAYQWQLNGSPLSGATNSSLLLPNVTTNQAGNYTVLMSDAFGSVASQVAVLTVILPSAAPPFISIQPASQTAAIGSTVSLSVTANGSAPLAYQWQLNGNLIAGATNSALLQTIVTTNQAGS